MPLLLSIVVQRNSNHRTALHDRSRIMLDHSRAELHIYLQMRRCRPLDAPQTLHLCNSMTRAMWPRLRHLHPYFPPEVNLHLGPNPKPHHLNLRRLLLTDNHRITRLTRSRLFPRKWKPRESPVICQLFCAQVDAQLLQRGVMEPPPGIPTASATPLSI